MPPYAGNPTSVICMVVEASPSHNHMHVSMLDGSKMINGEDTMTLEKVAEHLSGKASKPVVVAKLNHKGLPYGGDRVKITYYPTKDEKYVGLEWEWAN